MKINTFLCFCQDFKRAGISKEKGREQFWPKKGNLHRSKEKFVNIFLWGKRAQGHPWRWHPWRWHPAKNAKQKHYF
jgi:hypothetical protein